MSRRKSKTKNDILDEIYEAKNIICEDNKIGGTCGQSKCPLYSHKEQREQEPKYCMLNLMTYIYEKEIRLPNRYRYIKTDVNDYVNRICEYNYRNDISCEKCELSDIDGENSCEFMFIKKLLDDYREE